MKRFGMGTQAHVLTAAVAVAALGISACGGTKPVPKLASNATCQQFTSAPKASDRALVVQVLGAANAGDSIWVWSMCNSYDHARALGPVPALRTLIAVSKWNCNDWLGATQKSQTGFAKALVGNTNLLLRVRGTTASCANDPANMRVASSPADDVVRIAAGWTQPVQVDTASLPKTTSVADPDQCFERSSQLSAPSNAHMLAAGLGDCLAMGF